MTVPKSTYLDRLQFPARLFLKTAPFCILESSFLSERILRNPAVRRLLHQLVLLIFVWVLGTL